MKRFIGIAVLFISVGLCTEAQNDIRTNIIAGGKVVASGYDGMPYFIYEGDFDDTPFTTKNGEEQDPAYVGVLRNRRMTVSHFMVYGGNVYEDGGWFDSASGPVEVQVMVNPGDPWTTVAALTDYPELDGTDMAAAGVHSTGIYEVSFDPPISCVGIRVAGKGASGNTPGQSYVSINELRAFGELGEAVNTYEPARLEGAYPIGTNFRHPLERGGGAGGDVLLDGNTSTYVQLQELEQLGFKTFAGFFSANPLTLNSVSFVHGQLGEDGWFNTEESKPEVEIMRTLDSPWERVGVVSDYPDTNLNTFREDLPEDIETRAYTYTFSSPTEVMGVRFIGNGSLNLTTEPFIQIAEILIDGTGNPAYTGPMRNGLNNNGNRFSMNDQGVIHIEAENARSIRDAFTIGAHADASGNLLTMGGWGSSFNAGAYSGQEMQWDIVVPETNDYFIFAQGNAVAGWADSFFITFDDDPGFTEEHRGQVIWRPPAGEPAYSPMFFERDWFTTDQLGQDNQEFYTLTEGNHTLRMAYREPRHELDFIVITTDDLLDLNAYVPPPVDAPSSIMNFSIY